MHWRVCILWHNRYSRSDVPLMVLIDTKRPSNSHGHISRKLDSSKCRPACRFRLQKVGYMCDVYNLNAIENEGDKRPFLWGLFQNKIRSNKVQITVKFASHSDQDVALQDLEVKEVPLKSPRLHPSSTHRSINHRLATVTSQSTHW